MYGPLVKQRMLQRMLQRIPRCVINATQGSTQLRILMTERERATMIARRGESCDQEERSETSARA